MKVQKMKRRYVPALSLVVCLVSILYLPMHAEDRAENRVGFDNPAGVPAELNSTAVRAQTELISSTFSLPGLAAESHYPFQIQTFRIPEPQKQIQITVSSKPNFERTLYTSSLLTLTALNIADVITTMQALKHNGLTEGNPVMQPVVKNIYLFSAVKLSVAVMDYFLLQKLHKKNRTLGWVASLAANLAMSYVVTNNIRKIQQVQAR
ncbi:MAG: hypothetical protein JXB23_13590 [Candidatus Aminicenantes bacterium]|nr:hypothetical protein [Candidatus Aminicenantes bacterium]